MPTCRRTPLHCRKIKSGNKAKRPCTKRGSPGTFVKGYYSPKKICTAAAKIQAAARRMTKSKKHTAASKIQSALKKFSAKKSGLLALSSSSSIAYAETIKAGHGKVKVGEKFKTSSGTYMKTGSAPGKYKKM